MVAKIGRVRRCMLPEPPLECYQRLLLYYNRPDGIAKLTRFWVLGRFSSRYASIRRVIGSFSRLRPLFLPSFERRAREL